MILQALTQLYQDLSARGDIARRGWSNASISYALCLSEDGSLSQVVPLHVEEQVGKKKGLRPRKMELPARVTGRTGLSTPANFLWDNSSYLMGVDGKGDPKRSRKCFEACAELHHQLLDDVDTAAARAVLAYFDKWQPENAHLHPALADCWEDVMKGANLVFRYDGRFVQEDPAIQAAWDSYYGRSEGEKVQCLVTGRLDVPELVHPFIKGVADAQSSGASIVSFNAPAFCSYGKKQSLNAPVGKYAAFAYTSALNYLLADRDNVQRTGDTTVVCWAEGAEPNYQKCAFAALFGAQLSEQITTDTLRSIVKRLADQKPCEELNLDPSRNFYILGLAPNAARLSVRFFCRNTFGELMQNINEHHERMRIVGRQFEYIPLWAMLRETVNLKSTDKSPSPVVAGATARAIFSGLPYPAALLEATMLRIRSEREITPGRAAILKAYLLKNHADTNTSIKEVAQEVLNRNCDNQPYLLGRLFAVLEKIQLASAEWNINRSIKDSYFTSITTTPTIILKKILQLSEYHMKKLYREKRGIALKLEKEKSSIMCKISVPIPSRFTPEEATSFYLGYYHQMNYKEENEE